MSKSSYIKRFGARIAARDGWVCYYCGAKLVPHGTPESDERYYETLPNYRWSEIIGYFRALRDEYKFPTIDHIIPRVEGGSDDLSNLVLACRDCNSLKCAMPQNAFVALIESRWQS